MAHAGGGGEGEGGDRGREDCQVGGCGREGHCLTIYNRV